MKQLFLPIISVLILLTSCGFGKKTEANLTPEDLTFIQQIIPLDADEKIELFESNGGLRSVKKSGNFITNKRLASYWRDGKNDHTDFLEYKEIDSLTLIDKSRSLIDASYITVYSASKGDFKLYVSADSTRTWDFFNQAERNLNNKRTK
jgi:hypothetical protein